MSLTMHETIFRRLENWRRIAETQALDRRAVVFDWRGLANLLSDVVDELVRLDELVDRDMNDPR